VTAIKKLVRLLIGAGTGILFIWLAACLVNIFRFHRFEWFFTHSHNFLYSGIVLVLLGGALRLCFGDKKHIGTLSNNGSV